MCPETDQDNEIEILISSLINGSRNTKVKAARSLADIGDERALKPLLEVWRQDDIYAAKFAMEKIKERKNIDFKSTEIENHPIVVLKKPVNYKKIVIPSLILIILIGILFTLVSYNAPQSTNETPFVFVNHTDVFTVGNSTFQLTNNDYDNITVYNPKIGYTMKFIGSSGHPHLTVTEYIDEDAMKRDFPHHGPFYNETINGTNVLVWKVGQQGYPEGVVINVYYYFSKNNKFYEVYSHYTDINSLPPDPETGYYPETVSTTSEANEIVRTIHSI